MALNWGKSKGWRVSGRCSLNHEMRFVLSVHAVVARAGFAKAQGISAVFVEGSGVVALFLRHQLLDLV
jgi:hypothetical protein